MSGHLTFTGDVRSDGHVQCTRGAMVLLQRKTRDGWSTVANDATNRDGRYRAELDFHRTGRYRAKLDRSRHRNHVCQAAYSRVQMHRH